MSITTAKNTDPKGAREDALVLFTFTPYIYIYVTTHYKLCTPVKRITFDIFVK